MSARSMSRLIVSFCVLAASLAAGQDKKPPYRLNIDPPHISTDKSVKYDFDIVYVRGRRREDGKQARWAEFSRPTMMEPGADLMLLHPDGGAEGSVMDAYVSFDGESVCYAKFIDTNHTGPTSGACTSPRERPRG